MKTGQGGTSGILGVSVGVSEVRGGITGAQGHTRDRDFKMGGHGGKGGQTPSGHLKQCLANLAELKQADDDVLFVFTRSDDCVSCAGRGS